MTGTGAEESSYYGYNAHTDVEQITSEAGDTRATYGYTAYGKNDDKLFTGIDKPDPVDPTAKEEYNPYRFNAKRWDNSTGMYDMGFRDYNPNLNRFLNLDSYNGALDDLGLGLDPWTANRYAFTGGNPITGIELDGHVPNQPDTSTCASCRRVPIKTNADGTPMASVPNPQPGETPTPTPSNPKQIESTTPTPQPGQDIDAYYKRCEQIGHENCSWGKAEIYPIVEFFSELLSDACDGFEGKAYLACSQVMLLSPGGIAGKSGRSVRDIFAIRPPNKLRPPRADVTAAMKNGCHPNTDCDEIAEDLLAAARMLRRRLTRDYETLPPSSQAMIHIVSIDNLTKRITDENTHQPGEAPTRTYGAFYSNQTPS